MKTILFISIIFANIFYNMATGKDGGGEPSQRKGKRPLENESAQTAGKSRRIKGKFADDELSKATAGGFINFDEIAEEPTEFISAQKKPKRQRIVQNQTKPQLTKTKHYFTRLQKQQQFGPHFAIGIGQGSSSSAALAAGIQGDNQLPQFSTDQNQQMSGNTHLSHPNQNLPKPKINSDMDKALNKLNKKYDRLENELRNIQIYEIQNADYLTEEEQKRIDENKTNLNREKTELEKQIKKKEKIRQQIMQNIQENDALAQSSSSLETGKDEPFNDNQQIVQYQNPIQTFNHPHQQQMQSANSLNHYLHEQEQRLGQEIAARIGQGSSASAGIAGQHQQIQGYHNLPQISVDQKKHMKGETNLSPPSENMSQYDMYKAMNKLNKKYDRLENELRNIQIYEIQNADYLTEEEKKKIDENKAEIQAQITIMANEKQELQDKLMQMMAGKKRH